MGGGRLLIKTEKRHHFKKTTRYKKIDEVT